MATVALEYCLAMRRSTPHQLIFCTSSKPIAPGERRSSDALLIFADDVLAPFTQFRWPFRMPTYIVILTEPMRL